MNFHQPLRVISDIATRLNQRMKDNLTDAVLAQARSETGLKPAMDEVRRHLQAVKNGWELGVQFSTDASGGIKVLMGLDLIDEAYVYRGTLTLEFIYFPSDTMHHLALTHLSVTVPPDKQTMKRSPPRTQILATLEVKADMVSTSYSTLIYRPLRNKLVDLLTQLQGENVFDSFSNGGLDSFCHGLNNA